MKVLLAVFVVILHFELAGIAVSIFLDEQETLEITIEAPIRELNSITKVLIMREWAGQKRSFYEIQ
jgi:hypothetical protein